MAIGGLKGTLLAGVAVVAVLGSVPVEANAAWVKVDGTFSGNECGAGGFSNCKYNGSPSIIKYNWDENTGKFVNGDKNTGFPSVQYTDFTFSGVGTDGKSGTWSYNQTGDDPGVTAWIVSAGNNYFAWTGSGTTGSWTSTPEGKRISHITFFDTGVNVPVPAALPLLATALVGLGAVRRRKPLKAAAT